MYFGTDLPDALKAGLKELAEEKSVDGKPLPVRVLPGRFRVYQPGEWTKEHADANEVDLDFANEHGLTVVDWGSASQQYPRSWDTLTGLVYKDSGPRNLAVKDVIVPQDGDTRSALPYEVGGLEDHFELGEIGKRIIWYFINVQHVPSPDELELETFLFEPARRALDPEVMDNFEKEMEERSARAFAKLMTNNPQQRYERQQTRIREMEGTLRASEEQILTTRTQLDSAQKELEAILELSKADPEHFINQWRRIADHPLISPNTLQMAEQKLTYDTRELMLHHPSEDREVVLGRMRVNLNLRNNTVQIENLSNRRRNRDHPHIEGGSPCWGGYASELGHLLEEHEIAGVVEFIFGYLQTYNPNDDWGRFAAYWFENPATPEAETTTEAVEA